MLFISYLSNLYFFPRFYLENINHRCIVDDNSLYWPVCKSDKYRSVCVYVCVHACACYQKRKIYTDQDGKFY